MGIKGGYQEETLWETLKERMLGKDAVLEFDARRRDKASHPRIRTSVRCTLKCLIPNIKLVSAQGFCYAAGYLS